MTSPRVGESTSRWGWLVGHQRLGTLPATLKWRKVVELIAAGADVTIIAAEASKAAERQLKRASNDPGLKNSFWLIVQIPLTARTANFSSDLSELGIHVGGQPTLVEIGAAMSDALDRRIVGERPRTDLGEIAQLSAIESLQAVAGKELPDLFGTSPEKTRRALRALAEPRQFAALARDFFSRLLRRTLGYFLGRELPQHVGDNARFHTIRELMEFERALDQHCWETSLIIQSYAAGWLAKVHLEDRLTESSAKGFASYALEKLCAELEKRRTSNA